MKEFELYCDAKRLYPFSLTQIVPEARGIFGFPLTLNSLLFRLEKLSKGDVLNIKSQIINLEEILTASQHLIVISQKQPSASQR